MSSSADAEPWQDSLPDLAYSVRARTVSFDQLVEAWAGSHEHGAAEKEYAAAYPTVLASFQEAHGDLVERRYCGDQDEFAVALTRKWVPGRRRWYAFWRERAGYDWRVHLRFGPPASADLLALQDQCRYFQVQQYRISHERYRESFARGLYEVSRTVLQLDAAADGPAAHLGDAAKGSMGRVQARYDWIQSRLARFDYMKGVLIGSGVITLFLLILLLLATGLGWPSQTATVLLGMTGGAAAAAANALLRLVQGTPVVEGDESRLLLALFGALRPALGAIFALIAYALILGALVPVKVPAATDTMFWFVIGIAFIAGFSENFAPDLVQKASAV